MYQPPNITPYRHSSLPVKRPLPPFDADFHSIQMHVYLHEGSMLHSSYYMFHINHYSNYYSGWSRQFRDPVLFRDGGTLTGPVHRDVGGGRGQPFMTGVNAGGPGTVSVPAKDYSHLPILCNLCPWPCPHGLLLFFNSSTVWLKKKKTHQCV